MKRCLFTLFLFLPFIVLCQEITLSEVDGFTNERSVETSIISLKQGLTTGFGVSYTSHGRNYYLNIIGYGNDGTVVGEKDKIWLVLDDGSVVKLEYRAQIPDNGSSIQNIYYHHYIIRLDEVEVLKNHKVTMFRIMGAYGNTTDIPLSSKSSKRFSLLSNIFLREVSKDEM